jgi:hypothetical protein
MDPDDPGADTAFSTERNLDMPTARRKVCAEAGGPPTGDRDPQPVAS